MKSRPDILKVVKRLLVSVTFLVLGYANVLAQQPFEFRRFDMNSGLLNNHVNVISQTENGHLVIGDREGLSIFDGSDFRAIKVESDTTGIGEVLSIRKRKDGSMLIGTANGELYEYFDKKLIHIKNSLEDGIVEIINNTENNEEVLFTKNLEVLIVGGKGCKAEKALASDILLTSVGYIEQNSYLIGTNEGLFSGEIGYNYGFRLTKPFAGIPTSKITSILHEPEKRITWIATEDDGLFIIENILTEHQTTRKVRLDVNLDGINHILRDRFGSVWLSTFGNGIFKLDMVSDKINTALISVFNTANGSLKNNFVKEIFQDSEGNMWVSNFGNGLTQIVESVFYEPFDAGFLQKHTINTILHDQLGRIWLGMESGVFMMDRTNGSSKFRFFYVGGNAVNSICEDRFGTIWLGTPKAGLWKIRANSKSFSRVPISSSPLGNFVNDITPSGSGVIVCTKGGLFGVNSTGQVELILTTLQGLPHNNIKSAVEDSKGRLWIGANGNRITYYAEGEIRSIEKGSSQRIVDVNTILEDKKGRLWFGTNGNGIYVLEGSKVTNLSRNTGLQTEYVYQIIEDNDGLIWAVHQTSISLINDSIQVIRNVGSKDFNIGESSRITSTHTDNEGNTWITTSHGVVKYNPRVNQLIGESPQVEIIEMLVENEPEALVKNLILPYKKYSIQFNYVGVSLRDPSGLKYKYRLTGYSNKWSEPVSTTSIQFPRLENGSYNFEVLVAKQNGKWSQVPASFSFTIKRPFWKTPWFIALATLILVSGIFLFIRYRTYKLVRDNIELEKIIADRTKEIQTQKEEIEEHRDQIEKTAKDVTDSIKYAKRIQKAIFPANLDIKRILPESFIFFRSKGIVSGDFYFVEEVLGKTIFAAVDCTGHGVPGAFISLVANNLLKQAVLQNGITQPAGILNFLNKGITETLHQTYEESSVRDGLDIALCCWDKRKGEIEFAGAFNPMYIFRNGELHQYKGNRFPVGVFVGEKMKKFTNHVVKVEPGDMVYIFSDGFSDQFGGKEGKKLKMSGFRNFLYEIHKKPVHEQYEAAFNTLKDYQGDLDQVDDIIVMGVRIT